MAFLNAGVTIDDLGGLPLLSAERSKLRLPISRAEMRDIIVKTTAISKERDGSIRYWLSSGAGSLDIGPAAPDRALVEQEAAARLGELTVGDVAQSMVDIERRRSISRAHTATHMVHKAFREALGDTATQAGSENSPGRFRFDFSAIARPTATTTLSPTSLTSCVPWASCER